MTHARVIAAARELLVEEGVEALTMRELARRLDVSPNALYSHVHDKAELVDEVLDDLLALISVPDSEHADWHDALVDLMTSTHEVLLAHPGLVPLFVARRGARGANAQRLGAIMLERLLAGGVGGAQAVEAQRALIVYTIGSAAFATRSPIGADLDEAQLPETSKLMTNFNRGLRWLLDGIARPTPAAKHR